MGFHRRHIDDSSLLANAMSHDLAGFNMYMLNADDYMFEGEYACCFWEFYAEEKSSREALWSILRMESDLREQIIKMVCKGWEMVNNPKNNEDHQEAIINYLDLAENAIKSSEGELVKALVDVLKNRIKRKS
jgi:hypothetical protein